MDEDLKPLTIIVSGPPKSGKSDLAMALYWWFHAIVGSDRVEILDDSTQEAREKALLRVAEVVDSLRRRKVTIRVQRIQPKPIKGKPKKEEKEDESQQEGT